MATLEGMIEKIVFSNEDSGFAVVNLVISEHESIALVGTLNQLIPGESVEVIGQYRHHPTFGKQFVVDEYTVTEPKTILGITRYLESGLIKGIGKTYAKRIVSTFKEETLNVIDQTPEKLGNVPGIGTKRLHVILDSLQKQKSARHIMVFLRSNGIGAALAQKIHKKYQDRSIQVIKENPYVIASELYGVGFKTADDIARELGIPHDHPSRLENGLLHHLHKIKDEGHTCSDQESLLEAAEKLLEVEKEKLIEPLKALIAGGSVVEKQINSQSILWLKSLYYSELGITRLLIELMHSPCSIRDVDIPKAVDWIEQKLSMHFAPEQKKAIEVSLSSKIHIITGGPGTGKSTITKAIIGVLSKVAKNIVLAAPTGKAAKRLTEITHHKASTIHALLEFDFQTKGFKRNQDNPIACDCIIIDEVSMVDTFLMYQLLKALPIKAKVLFVGDVDQLPSVGPGTILQDMIDSNSLPVTTLTEIFRQKKTSRIITNAHRINRGIIPNLSPDANSDFQFVAAKTPEDALQAMMKLVTHDIPMHHRYHPTQDIQVLAPMRKGLLGIENLNHQLQDSLNHETVSILQGGRRFKVADKVMQIRNNYQKNVLNGDVGFITSINHSDGELTVSYDGDHITYDFAELDEITLAYASSIHKFQGSECPCIVLLMHLSHFKMLHRNLLYTGVTRGKKRVYVIGNQQALAIAVKSDNILQRKTMLKEMLASPFSTNQSDLQEKPEDTLQG